MHAAADVGDGRPLFDDGDARRQILALDDLGRHQPADLVEAFRDQHDVRRPLVLLRFHPRLTQQLSVPTTTSFNVQRSSQTP